MVQRRADQRDCRLRATYHSFQARILARSYHAYCNDCAARFRAPCLPERAPRARPVANTLLT